MGQIIVDTSSILFGFSNKVDVFSKADEQLGLTPVISKGVVKELTLLSTGKGANSKNAKLALSIIKHHGIKAEDDESYVDRWILNSSTAFKNVCTNDTKLRRELKARGITVYTLSRDGTLR